MRAETLPFESDPPARELPLWFTATGLLCPAGWLLGFWSLVLRARAVTGEWPHGRSGNYFEGTMRPETIDPKALGLHSDVVLLWALLLLYVVPLALLLLGVSIFDKRLRQPPALVVAFLASSALVALTIGLDPGGFVEWLAD
jgi:hypothetical protein